MGVKLSEIIKSKEIELDLLTGKIIAIDAFNFLYQFLSTIRASDGSLLKNSKGKTTSHIVGLFSRTINFLEKGIKIVYVYDGESPIMKQEERERRKQLKEKALEEYEKAEIEEDIELMKKYSKRLSRLNEEMIEDSKKLLDALGVPYIQAPSEGEAQASMLVKEKKAYATASEDYDSLLFGSPKLVRQLTTSGKRRKSNKIGYYTVKPQIIDLNENLNYLGIDQEQLIILGILVGTDFNPGGIKGIGPKKDGKNFKELFKEVKYEEYFKTTWKEICAFFKTPPTKKIEKIEFKNPDYEKIKKLLVEEFEFSEERVEKQLEKLKASKKKEQKTLNSFFS